MSIAYLILENGAVFKGRSFGYDAETIGELVFSTGMTGYLETLTDPGYFGQIVLQTFPLIGNYGIIPADKRSETISVKGYIVREWCQEPSNFRSEGELDTFLRLNKTAGICGLDTRALTRIIRENGVMNAMISKTPELTDEQWYALKAYKPGGVSSLPEQAALKYDNEDSKYNVALWDFGAAHQTAGDLSGQNCGITIIKHSAGSDEILNLRPDGIVLSDGPGDPAENTGIIKQLEKLCAYKIPVLGIGLGHQLLALANGAKTEKLPFGHRGTNQPVRDSRTGRVFVTTQNHGYTVVPESLPKTAEMNCVNCNDDTCEGIEYSNIPALSVQFRPDLRSSGSGEWVFNRFAQMMDGGENNAAE